MNNMTIEEKINKKKIGKIEKNVSLSKYTTYKAGGKAKLIVYPKNIDKLVELLKLLKEDNVGYKILGNGSNLIFNDTLYKDVLIKLNEINHLDIHDTTVIAGAGCSLINVAMKTANLGLTGMEFATGIPGTIGGAIYMNAGAYKSDMGYITTNVTVLTNDLKIITLTNSEMDFHYRSSYLQKHKDYICLEAVLKLTKGDRKEIEEITKERRERRMESQPLEYPSAGSVFRNPEGMYAGKLIEDLGLKGLTKGGAEVSLKHANFVINKDGATAKDIHDLIVFVHDAVLDRYGVDLKIEQEFVNWE